MMIEINFALFQFSIFYCVIFGFINLRDLVIVKPKKTDRMIVSNIF